MPVSRRARTSFPDLVPLQRRINQLFERLLEYQGADAGPNGEWRPGVDVYEAHGRLLWVMEVPGVAPDALRVSVQERELVIAGERRAPRPQGEGATFLCVERPYRSLPRVLPLHAP